ACADTLDVTSLENSFVPHAVAMLKRAAQNVSDDLHVAMWMRAKAAAARDGIVVDHAQTAEPHPVRIVVVCKREAVMCIQPAVISVAPFVGFSNYHHNGNSIACRVPLGQRQDARWRMTNDDKGALGSDV